MPVNEEKNLGEVAKRSYSDEEIAHIYELARFHLENGDVKKAQAIVLGLIEVAPQFPPVWLAHAYIHVHNKDYESAVLAARHALKLDGEFIEAIFYLIVCMLTLGDYNSAGTYLGEISDRIESGQIDNPNLIRFFKGQLVRYQNRSSLPA